MKREAKYLKQLSSKFSFFCFWWILICLALCCLNFALAIPPRTAQVDYDSSDDETTVLTRIIKSNQQAQNEGLLLCYEPDFQVDFRRYVKLFISFNSSTMVTKFDATVQQQNGRSDSCPLDVSTECVHIMSAIHNVSTLNNSGVVTIHSCCVYLIEVFTDKSSVNCSDTAVANNECRRAVILQLLDEWNPNGYYTITVVVNLQFDPVLLAYLHHLSVSSSISSDNTLIDNTEMIDEKDVPSKPWDNQLYPPFPLIENFTDGCNRINPAYTCEEICATLNNGQKNCKEACINVTSYTHKMERRFYPLSHNSSYRIEVMPHIDTAEISHAYRCHYIAESANFQKSCIPADPPSNLTVLNYSCSVKSCEVYLSWDVPVYVKNGTDYLVYVNYDEVSNTLIGQHEEYLNKEEERLSRKIFIGNQNDDFTVKITFNISTHEQYYIQVRRNNTCNEGLLKSWSDSVNVVIPRNNTDSFHDQGFPAYWYAVIGGSSACLLFAVMLVTCLLFCCYKQQKDSPIIHELRILPPGVPKCGSLLNMALTVDDWEIPNAQIFMPDSKYVARGNFGEVYKGFVRGNIKRLAHYITEVQGYPVAVKLLPANASGTQKEDFLQEIKLMKKVSDGGNPYIVNMVGCCTVEEPLALLLEFAPHGNLLDFVKALPKENNAGTRCSYINDDFPSKCDAATLLKYGFEICSGMEYLCSLNIIHRDLACRNILVGNDYTMKITDFGLSRQLYDDPAYVQLEQGKVPLRWMAIEAISERKYTFYSDVWSFGVVLWEIFAYVTCYPQHWTEP